MNLDLGLTPDASDRIGYIGSHFFNTSENTSRLYIGNSRFSRILCGFSHYQKLCRISLDFRLWEIQLLIKWVSRLTFCMNSVFNLWSFHKHYTFHKYNRYPPVICGASNNILCEFSPYMKRVAVNFRLYRISRAFL